MTNVGDGLDMSKTKGVNGMKFDLIVTYFPHY